MRRRILVATGLSPESDEAIVQGEARARRDHAALTVVHVAPSLHWGVPRELERQAGCARAAAIERVIERRVRDLTGRSPGTFEVLVESGLPHVVLTRLAVTQHAVLVIGSGSARAAARYPGLTENITALSRVPVLVARPTRRADCVLAVVARSLDGVLETAAQEAELSHRKLILLHVDSGPLSANATESQSKAQCSRSRLMTAHLLRARQQLNLELAQRGIELDLRLENGSVEQLIAQFSRSLGAAMVVVSAPEPELPMTRAVNHLLHSAPCPVLVAKRERRPDCTARWLLN